MSFVNAGMLYGTACASIPIIIYLLYRHKVKELEWAAMQFILDILEQQRKRITLEDLLLLLLRTLMLLFLALGVARPILTGAAGAMLGGAQDSLIVLDSSYSMQTRDGAKSRWESATGRAVGLLDNMPSKSGVSLLKGSIVPDAIISSFDTNIDLMRETVRNLKPTALAGSPAIMLGEIEHMLKQSESAVPTVYIISDFQKRDWDGEEKSLAQTIKKLAKKYTVNFIPVADAVTENVSASSFKLVSGSVRTGIPTVLAADFYNHGDELARNIPIDLLIDGSVTENASISIPPKQSSRVLFRPTFNDAGLHKVKVRIRSDLLSSDNERRLALTAGEPAKILAVSDALDRKGKATGAGFIELALTPYREGSKDKRALFDLRHISMGDFSVEQLDDYSVVIIADVTGFTKPEATMLEEYVTRGGGVMMFFGSSVSPSAFNANLHRDGEGLLPWALDEELMKDKEEDPLKFTQQEPLHPVWGVLGGRDDYITHLKFYNAYGFIPGSKKRVTVLAEVLGENADTPSPFMLDVKHGQGHALLIGTSADTKMNNFALRPAYVAYINQAVRYLRSFKSANFSQLVGQRHTRFMDFRHSQATYNLVSPSEDTQTISVLEKDKKYTLSLPPLEEAGFYQLENQADTNDAQLIAVNTDTKEGDIRCMSAAELAEKFPDAQVHDTEDMASIFESGASATELAGLFLILMALCWLGENLLAYRISKR